MEQIVETIQRIREQRKKLETQESELMKNFGATQCDIQQIQSAFLTLKKIDKIKGKEDEKLFVFICLSVFSPTFILGDSIKRGVVGRIAQHMGYKQATKISHISNTMRFFYFNYKNFKLEADYLYSEIMRSLKS